MKILILIVSLFCLHEKVHACEYTYYIGIGAFWPVAYPDAGKRSGAGYDFAEEIRRRTKCRVITEEISIFRKFKDFENRKFDIILFNIKHASRAAEVGEYVPIFKFRRILLLRPQLYKETWTIQNYVEAPGIRFAGAVGTRFAFSADETKILDKSNRYVETTDPGNVLSVIGRGGADATFFVEGVYDHYRNQLSAGTELKVLNDRESWVEIGIDLAKQRLGNLEIQRIKSAVESMKKDGFLKKMISKYINKTENAVVD